MTRPNQQQSDAWNGPESAHYVEHADRYDRQLAPVSAALLERAAIGSDDRVLDVACGSGFTALAAADGARTVLGVDISGPLVALATERARRASLDNVEFVVADAQVHDFDTGAFDVVISQFGLMFFDDPVTAFSNLRRASTPDGRIVFAAWQGLGANDWLAPVVRAVEQHTAVPDLGGLANGGGMFALKHEDEIRELLTASGFHAISVDPIAPTLLVGGGLDLDESVGFLLGMGIVRGLLGRLDAEQREQALDAVRADLEDRYDVGTGVSLGAGVWMVSARTSNDPGR